jgi:hypothetical protein
MWISPFPWLFLRNLHDDYWNIPDPEPSGQETKEEFLDFFREIQVERLDSLSRKETVTYRRFFLDFRYNLAKISEAYNMF